MSGKWSKRFVVDMPFELIDHVIRRQLFNFIFSQSTVVASGILNTDSSHPLLSLFFMTMCDCDMYYLTHNNLPANVPCLTWASWYLNSPVTRLFVQQLTTRKHQSFTSLALLWGERWVTIGFLPQRAMNEKCKVMSSWNLGWALM